MVPSIEKRAVARKWSALLLVAEAAALASVVPGMALAKGARTEARSPATNASPAARGQMFALVFGPGSKWTRGQPLRKGAFPQHLEYWRKLHADGLIASAGPLGRDTALVILRARNQAEADRLVASDPAVKARLLSAVVRPYAPSMVNVAALDPPTKSAAGRTP